MHHSSSEEAHAIAAHTQMLKDMRAEADVDAHEQRLRGKLCGSSRRSILSVCRQGAVPVARGSRLGRAGGTT